jgi:hypothetical protein
MKERDGLWNRLKASTAVVFLSKSFAVFTRLHFLVRNQSLGSRGNILHYLQTLKMGHTSNPETLDSDKKFDAE